MKPKEKITNQIAVLRKSNNWDAFNSHLDALSGKEKLKGDCFEELTEHYLKLHPRYATIIKNVWNLRKESSKNIKRKLELPSSDEGIDLVAETNEGEYWAIQCKYLSDPNQSLGRKQLSTFTDLALNLNKNFSLALVCTSGNRFSYKLQKFYGDRISLLAGDSFRELNEEFFSLVHAELKGRAKKIKKLTPRAHQKRAIGNAHKHFIKEKESRGKMIMPCGSGKSLSAYWIGEKLGAKRILVAVPSLALIRQTLDVWARESLASGRSIRWICVCSDESVGKVANDDISLLTQDLGVEVKSKPEDISNWLKRKTTAISVVFVTYHSGEILSEASADSNYSFDLGIFDEAHKTVGVKGKLFGHLLFDRNINIEKRLFMTATERRYQGVSENILSMDDPETYGDTFELLSFKEALECDPPILCDYQIVTIAVTTKEIETLIRSNVFVKPSSGKSVNEIEAKMLAAVIQLRKTMKEYPLSHCISFHQSIARAKAFQETNENVSKTFPEYGELNTYHVTGAMPTSQRQEVLDEAISSDRSLITNSRCLTEGVDVKQIDGVLFADPKGSAVDIVQAVGRALRPHKGKKMGYVLVPIIIDSDKIEDRVEQSEAYADLLTVLRALASNDERIIEHFRSIAEGKKSTKGRKDFIFTIPESLEIDSKGFARQVELKIWDKLAKLSWRPFEEARKFANSLLLEKWDDWNKYCDGELKNIPPKPKDIPNAPQSVYHKNGWAGVGDWLGTGSIASFNRTYCDYKSARQFVVRLNLKDSSEWRRYCKGEVDGKPEILDYIPKTPWKVYKGKGWTNIGDWLGVPIKGGRNLFSFKKARAFVHKLGLKNRAEWIKYCNGELQELVPKPDAIPNAPQSTYEGKGWSGVGDWLGTGVIAAHLKEYLRFEEARAFVHKLGLKNSAEWKSYCKGEMDDKPPKPSNIPSKANSTYKDSGWVNFSDWIGVPTAARYRKFLPFKEARAFVHKLGLKNSAEWKSYCKGEMDDKPPKPINIPVTPYSVYRGRGWSRMGDWLGTGRIQTNKRSYRSFTNAKKFVRELKLRSGAEWKKYCKGELINKPPKPIDIPISAYKTYKDKGWKGMKDFLGIE